MPFDPNRLTDYPLFQEFWINGRQGTARRGLDEVTPEGVDHLVDFAKGHELDGTASAAGHETIDEDEKALVRAILSHNFYGTFFEQDARPRVFDRFGRESIA